jgi:hypothetical protein
MLSDHITQVSQWIIARRTTEEALGFSSGLDNVRSHEDVLWGVVSPSGVQAMDRRLSFSRNAQKTIAVDLI